MLILFQSLRTDQEDDVPDTAVNLQKYLVAQNVIHISPGQVAKEYKQHFHAPGIYFKFSVVLLIKH